MHKGSQPVMLVSFYPSDLPLSFVLFSEGPLVVNEIVHPSVIGYKIRNLHEVASTYLRAIGSIRILPSNFQQVMPALYKSLAMLGFRSEFSTILTPR